MFTKRVIYFVIIAAFAVSYLATADVVTKVLQNGTEGYEGCKDSHTWSVIPEDNYSTEDRLLNHNCQN